MSFNRSLMTQMEHWTPKETPRLNDGHQTLFPLVAGGAALRTPKKGGNAGGKSKGKRRVWREKS